jgi:acrylyl-CoA reductase (NADPH)
MSHHNFRALVLDKENGNVRAAFQTLSRDALPAGDVLISVAYSSLNYKDALAVTNKGRVVRKFPMVPGIDLVGVVEESASPEFAPGDAVVLSGWGIGERHWGGYAQLARARTKWLIPLPEELSPEQAMGVGTAGFTAMLCVMALEAHGLVSNNEREVVVTGASGGVGSVAVAILANLGYTVVASTGRSESHQYLRRLGAARIIDRNELAAPPGKPLESARWGGAVDTVGGQTLASLLASMAYRTSVAACGLAGGVDLPTSVHPFILRGVNLLGIDSVLSPPEERRAAWARLARDLPLAMLDEMMRVEPLSDIFRLSEQILQGQIRGRVVIDVNA